MNSFLLALYEGLQGTAAFIEALARHELLEPFTLDVQLDDGSRITLAGLYTIAEERLRALDGDALARLSRDGHLEPIYMAVASLSNLRILIERMNRRSEEHTSELQSLMRISYAVFCLKKKKTE